MYDYRCVSILGNVVLEPCVILEKMKTYVDYEKARRKIIKKDAMPSFIFTVISNYIHFSLSSAL